MATLITRFISVLVLIMVCGSTQHNNTPNNTQLSPQHLWNNNNNNNNNNSDGDGVRVLNDNDNNNDSNNGDGVSVLNDNNNNNDSNNNDGVRVLNDDDNNNNDSNNNDNDGVRVLNDDNNNNNNDNNNNNNGDDGDRVLNYDDGDDNDGVLEGHHSSSSVTHIRNTRQLQGNIPSPTSLQAIVQGPDTVLLKWKYEGPHLDTHLLVKIYVNNDIFIKDQVVLPSENSVTITDLTPNTQYSITITTVKALPRGRQVTSVTTDPVTVTTQDLDLPPPTNLQITSRDLTSVSLQWQYNGPRLDLNFLVKIYESSDNFFIKDQVVRDTSVTVSDLTPNTHYTFIVTAVKALPRGRHLSSTPVTITTQQGGPPQPQPQPTQPQPPTTTTTTTPQPSLPGNQGSGVCSLITSPGVTYNILSCSIPTSHSPLSFARTNECVTGGGVAAVNTVIVADCWGIATLILRCESNGYWHQGSNNDQLSPPTQYLCQYQTINSPVCGKRPHYEKATQGLVLFGARPNWPWLVGLFIRETYSCVATLITPTYLLTAAHCIARSQDTTSTVDPRDIRVQHVGSDGTIQRQYVSSVWVVPDFTTRPHAMSDVGLVRLERTLTFSRSLYPACLATTTTTTTTDQHTAATFSRTSNQYKWDLVIQKPDRRCSNLGRDVCTEALTLQQHQFCAIDIDEAVFLKEGSSGGPYLVNAGNDANERWEVRGVVSYSHTHTHCTTPVTVFTSPANYLMWLAQCVHHGNCRSK